MTAKGEHDRLVREAEQAFKERPDDVPTIRNFATRLIERGTDNDLMRARKILQDAFAKVLDRPEQAPSDEGVVPWFYRTLRNAVIVRFRRHGAANRAVEAFARDLFDDRTDDREVEVRIGEIAFAGAVLGVPDCGVGKRILHRRTERHDIGIVAVAEAGSVGQEHA